jgi:hypothetical protein
MLEVGKPITDKQQQTFQRLLTARDIASVAGSTGLNPTDLYGIKNGSETITEENVLGLIGLITKSNEKVREALAFFNKAEAELNHLQKVANELGSNATKINS